MVKKNFEFEIIEFVEDKYKLIEREQFWIDELNVTDRNIGYNLSPKAGSCLGYKVKEETKAKLRLIGNIPIVQLTLDGKFIKEWISSRDAARKLEYSGHGSINRCVNGFLKTCKGYLWITKEDYLNGTYKDRITKPINRPVIQYDLDMNFIKLWAGVAYAQRELNIWNVRSACIGIQKSAGGFIWRYEDDVLKEKYNTPSSFLFKG